MADRISPEIRSRNMAAIRARDTGPEITVRRYLHAHGFRFRLCRKDLPGKPDIILPKYRTAIFVHGCFWHLHGCRNTVIPKTRTEWWLDKLEGNRARDQKNRQRLEQLDWHVITIWECEINPERLELVISDISGRIGLSRSRPLRNSQGK